MINDSQFLPLLNVVSDHFHVSTSAILGRARPNNLATARHVINYILYEKYGIPSTTAGNFLGRDHATVLHSCLVIKKNHRLLKTVYAVLDKLSVVQQSEETITWDQVIRWASSVASYLPKGHYDILAQPRGGLVVATLLAHLLGESEVFLFPYELARNGPSTLWVDDIVDTGSALKRATRDLRYITTASLVVRSTSPICPTFYGKMITHKSHVHFPWELTPAIGSTTKSTSETIPSSNVSTLPKLSSKTMPSSSVPLSISGDADKREATKKTLLNANGTSTEH